MSWRSPFSVLRPDSNGRRAIAAKRKLWTVPAGTYRRPSIHHPAPFTCRDSGRPARLIAACLPPTRERVVRAAYPHRLAVWSYEQLRPDRATKSWSPPGGRGFLWLGGQDALRVVVAGPDLFHQGTVCLGVGIDFAHLTVGYVERVLLRRLAVAGDVGRLEPLAERAGD